MSSSDENQDLQTYFDNFKGDIEESNDCVTLTAEALRALSEADAVTEKILEELSVEIEEEYELRTDVERPGDVDVKKENVYEFDENDAELKEPSDEGAEAAVVSGSVMHMVPETKKDSSNEAQLHQCPKCSYTTTKRFLLSRHLHSHSENRPYKCSVCERTFKLSPALFNHMNLHLGKKPHGCTYCEMRFNTSGELVRHVRYKHTGEKPHKCGECDYSSVELSKMRRHMRCHTGERPYQCPHCTYASPDTFKLKRHLRTHTGEKPYECDICLARFTQSNSLKSHRLIHTAGDRPSFQCSYCPTTCGRKTDLQLHIQKLHNADNPVKCKRCGKLLPDRYSYKVHVKTHEGEKCFRCKLCPHATTTQRLLDMHMLVHTDLKPFTCEECGSSFRQRQLLLRHVNFYHNEGYVPPTPAEKSHICPHCHRAFTRKGNLMRHMETHDSEINKEEEKQKLRIGRQIRIQSDGTITLPANDITQRVVQPKKNSSSSSNNVISNIELIDDTESQGERFAILEIEDDNVGNDDDAKLEEINKTEHRKESDQNQYILKHSNIAKCEQIGQKLDTVTVEMEDENSHFVVIEVVEGDAADDGILEIPIQCDRKSNAINFSNVENYVLPHEYKSSQITIMNVIDAD